MQRLVKISINTFFDENSLLGQGAFGKVYKGEIEKFGTVAVKVISLDTVNKNLLLKQESILQKIKQISHPNCTTYYGVILKEDEDCRQAYFFFELCKGSLLDLLFQGAIPENKVRKYFLDFMEGLSFLHSQGIIHRDLKPDNLLFSQDCLKISDFGLSRDLNNSYNPIQMTEQVGASVYRAPQLESRSYDYRCDVWSAGLILLQMLTGKIDVNYSARNLDIQKGIYKFQIQDFHPFWEEIIKKMLTYDKNKRPTSFQILEIYKKWLSEQIQKVAQPSVGEQNEVKNDTRPLFFEFKPQNNKEKELISPIEQTNGQNNLQMSIVDSFRERNDYHSVLDFVNHFEYYYGYKRVSQIAQAEVVKAALALGNVFSNFYVRSVLFLSISSCYLRFRIMIDELQKGFERIETINSIQPQLRENLMNYINDKLSRLRIFVRQYEDQQALKRIEKLLSYRNQFPEINSKYPSLLKFLVQLRSNIHSVKFSEIRAHIQNLERQIVDQSKTQNFLMLKSYFLFKKIFDFSRMLEQKDKHYPDFNQISKQLQNVKQVTVKEYFASQNYKDK